MNRHIDGFVDSRGTVLVASGSSLFMNIVGDMLVDCGFTAAFPAESEAASLSVTRTQPALVICDSGVPEANIEHLIVEVVARGLPLLMAWSQEEHDEYAPGLVLPNRVAWLTFPIDREAFSSTIDGLLPPVMGPVQRQFTMIGVGAKVEAAFSVRSLATTPYDEAGSPKHVTPVIADRTVRRSIRLVP
jgi:hypothetical protein